MEQMMNSMKDRLDYQGLIFRQIDRLAFASSTISGNDTKTAQWSRELGLRNFKSGLPILESMIIWKLSEDNREKYLEEKKLIPNYKIVFQNIDSAEKSIDAMFDLLMKYLPKTGLIAGQRKMYSSGGGSNESNV